MTSFRGRTKAEELQEVLFAPLFPRTDVLLSSQPAEFSCPRTFLSCEPGTWVPEACEVSFSVVAREGAV